MVLQTMVQTMVTPTSMLRLSWFRLWLLGVPQTIMAGRNHAAAYNHS